MFKQNRALTFLSEKKEMIKIAVDIAFVVIAGIAIYTAIKKKIKNDLYDRDTMSRSHLSSCMDRKHHKTSGSAPFDRSRPHGTVKKTIPVLYYRLTQYTGGIKQCLDLSLG